MKPKILFALLATLIILILINTLINRKSAKIQPVSEAVKHQQTVIQQQSALSDYAQQLPSASYNRPAITIIKPFPKEKPTPAARETEEKIEKRQQAKSSPRQSPAVSERGPDDLSDEPASGITKINKHPTEKENNEMNANGIVMY